MIILPLENMASHLENQHKSSIVSQNILLMWHFDFTVQQYWFVHMNSNKIPLIAYKRKSF